MAFGYPLFFRKQNKNNKQTDDFLFYDNSWYSFLKLKEYIPKGIEYLSNNKTIKPYVDLPIDKYKNIIGEIIIGPKSKLCIDDVYNFCLSLNIDISLTNIKKSNATYI